MSVLGNILTFLTSDIRTTLFTLIIGFIAYKIAKLYVRVYSLPPGPLPLPLLGNILAFKRKDHPDVVIKENIKKYGPVMTLWLGPEPNVFISDIDVAKDAFWRSELTGRPRTYFGDYFTNDKHTDVLMADYGHSWEALRRVSHSAVQKYSTTDNLVYLASDCVDKTFDVMIKKEGLNKAFIPSEYVFYLFQNILSTIAFGQSYDIDDLEYKQIKYFIRDFSLEIGPKLFLWEFSVAFRLLDRKLVNKLGEITNNLLDSIKNKFKLHHKDYSDTVIRDFCDALISAKNDALKEGKESAPYLTDENLAMSVFDMFFAGTNTSRQTFEWILLYFLYYTEIQLKLKEEIESEIGDRIPTHEDRNRCHYVMAFISEIMRFRNVAYFGLFHKAMANTNIGNFTIPKGMPVHVYQYAILTDEKHWKDPNQFNPERFLKDGKYLTTRPSAYIPFGLGRRVCLGEKLATANLFLVLVRFIQKTSEYDITLDNHSGVDVNPNIPDALMPHEYKIILNKT